MPFSFRTRKQTQTEIDLGAIKQRVRRISDRVGQVDVRLTDLFAMIGENDLIGRRLVPVEMESDIRRVLPKDV